MIQMSLTAKRWITSFWRTAVFTCSCWLTFFLFRCGFQEKREPSWKNYLIWTADWCGVHSTPDPQKALIIFLSVISKMQVIFWSEDNFCFISDCRNAFYCKLKKLINEQIIIFYSPSNALCSSDESVQIKHFKHHTFIAMFSPWFNLQIMNFCLWRHIES